MKENLFLVSIIFILFTSCQPPQQATNDELKQIIIDKYKKLKVTLQNADPTYVLNIHSNDAILFKADGTEVSGMKELSKFYEQVAKWQITIESTPLSIEKLSEDTVFEFGVFTSTNTAGKKHAAKYINIWKRYGNDWKIYKAIDHAAVAQ